MAGKSSTKGAAKTPAKSAEQAATTAAPAAAEQLATQPAAPTENAAQTEMTAPASTEQPVSEAPGLEAGETGQDAHLVVAVLGGSLDVAGYIEALKAGGVDVIPLPELAEHTLRYVGKFVEIEQYDVLPPEQLVSLIEAKVGIGAAVARSSGDGASDAPASDGSAASELAGSDDDLDDDGKVDGLWITAIPEHGFRRCGYRFTREGFGIALGALTAEQIEQLENEPNLKVERGIFSGRVGERVE